MLEQTPCQDIRKHQCERKRNVRSSAMQDVTFYYFTIVLSFCSFLVRLKFNLLHLRGYNLSLYHDSPRGLEAKNQQRVYANEYLGSLLVLVVITCWMWVSAFSFGEVSLGVSYLWLLTCFEMMAIAWRRTGDGAVQGRLSDFLSKWTARWPLKSAIPIWSN